MAYALAMRLSGPIRELEDGAKRIGSGQFDHRIALASGDELEKLASRFNEMAGELAISKQKSERIDRLKRFLAPQVAELVENSDGLLEGHRRDVVAVFADLRGFTAFSALAEPEIIIAALQEYYEVVGAVIARHEATLIQFAGDGVMILLNAPVACADPAHRAVRLAIDLQQEVQSLSRRWASKGYALGFGIGIGMGPATVGTIGYEGRLDYTAVGSAVNLASRLCDLAGDGQILVDNVVAEQVRGSIAVAWLGERTIKGYSRAIRVFAVSAAAALRTPRAARSLARPDLRMGDADSAGTLLLRVDPACRAADRWRRTRRPGAVDSNGERGEGMRLLVSRRHHGSPQLGLQLHRAVVDGGHF